MNHTVSLSGSTIFAGLVLLLIACGGGSGFSTDGGAGLPVNDGLGGAGAGGSGDISGVCAEVPCYATLINSCPFTAVCTYTSSTSTDGKQGTSTECFDNGVKENSVFNNGTSTIISTLVVKKGSSVCYSIDQTVPQPGSAGSLAWVIRDGSGNQVATATRYIESDMTMTPMTMTCTGGQPTVLSDACGRLPDWWTATNCHSETPCVF